MKALVWEGPRIMNMREVPEPTAADEEVVLRVGDQQRGIVLADIHDSSSFLGDFRFALREILTIHPFASHRDGLFPETGFALSGSSRRPHDPLPPFSRPDSSHPVIYRQAVP